MNPDPGGLTLDLLDDRVDITMTGGGSWRLPVGPVSLFEAELERGDPPGAMQLTNAIGAVQDRFEDAAIEAPSILGARSVLAVGTHARALAHVEVGHDDPPVDYRLRRADAEEVFRTLVAEPAAERRFNPGLPPERVDDIIGTCCVILAVMRRLDLPDIGVDVAVAGMGN